VDPNEPARELGLFPREREWCQTCGHPISAAEPDVILLHSEIALELRFHKMCALPAYQLVERDPRQWGLMHRRVEAEQN
jgi:hypothetical protein